ncbi:MAG: hypothetical protein FWF96_04445, partial [Kiritimatiellaeota bacterium]|nr:hypothetical protein [Kiritimatiellota bacterium]
MKMFSRQIRVAGAVAIAACCHANAQKTWVALMDDNAANPDNWSGGTLPVSTDTILLDASSTRDMFWECDGMNLLPDTVAGWIQDEAYTGTVTFPTTYPGHDPMFMVFTITGDVVLDGGTWTHPTNNATEAWRLSVYVGGDMTINTNAALDVQSRGYEPRTGPGNNSPLNQNGVGASHAGEAHEGDNNQVNALTYGRVLAPTALGSGAGNQGNVELRRAGAGAIALEVAGHLTLEGALRANGLGQNHIGGGSSGGSIFVKCATHSGAGLLNASGGLDTWHGSGGAGRIAVISGDPLPGGLVCKAFGETSRNNNGTRVSGAGTIFYGVDAARGTVVVDNADKGGNPTLATHLPAARAADQNEDLTLTDWRVMRKAGVKLRADAKINSLALEGASTALDLNGLTLRVKRMEVNGARVHGGTYAAPHLPPQVADADP